jgi:hypothetical protein
MTTRRPAEEPVFFFLGIYCLLLSMWFASHDNDGDRLKEMDHSEQKPGLIVSVLTAVLRVLYRRPVTGSTPLDLRTIR